MRVLCGSELEWTARGEGLGLCLWKTAMRGACGRWTISGFWFCSPSSRRLPKPEAGGGRKPNAP